VTEMAGMGVSKADSDVSAAGAPARVARGSDFWTVAFAFLIVAMSATLPSPLYGLYRTRDHLSAFTITIVYGVFAAGTIGALRAGPAIVGRVGRRGTMLAAVATMMAAAGLLAVWKALPGLVAGRLLTGVAVGLASGTAITFLIELRLRADPRADVARARVIGTSVNVGALGIGPLLAGVLAQFAKWPLTLSHLVMVGLGAVALAALAPVPETGSVTRRGDAATSGAELPSTPAAEGPRPRLPIPAAAATLAAFAANGLFAGLSGLFLSVTLHHPSHALSGLTLFLVFTSGVISQVATGSWPASRVLAFGTGSMLVGLVSMAVSVRLSSPSLALFLISGALIGAGAGAVFKGTTGLVLETTAPQYRLAMTSALLIVLFIGLSVPVIGAGIALDEGATAPDTVLVFAILVGLGVTASGWALMGRRSASHQKTTA